LASLLPESVPDSPAPADLVELGVLRGAYGVKGWVRVQPYAAQATAL
jgi:16S rRNA processing protein RimM